MEQKKISKKMKSLKLNQLTKEELDERSMSVLQGGVTTASPCNCNGWHYTIDYWKV